MKILISGSSGLIGKELTPLLESGKHEVWRLVRKEANTDNKEIFWDPDGRLINEKSLEGFDAIINLNGVNIAERRWTKAFKKELRDSRVNTTRFLSESINKLNSPPKVFISSSAIGFYGSRGSETLTEQSSRGSGFFPELSLEWECAALEAKNTRVVIIRTGIVLSKKGGAIKKMLLPFKLGLGGKLGDGKHFMSWISLEDECRAICFCLENENIKGPVNLTAPKPVSNAEFTKQFAKALNRPAIFPVPYLVAKILFGEMADEALFASADIRPEKLLNAGFNFNDRDLESFFSKGMP